MAPILGTIQEGRFAHKILVPFDEVAKQRLVAEYLFFRPATIPAGTYPGQDEPYEGLDVGSMHLIVSADQDEELVYYPPAAIRVHESVSPPIKNKSHELVAEVTIPEDGGDGMLVTAGGRTAGYALFVKNGRLTYVYNYIGIDRTVPDENLQTRAPSSSMNRRCGRRRRPSPSSLQASAS